MCRLVAQRLSHGFPLRSPLSTTELITVVTGSEGGGGFLDGLVTYFFQLLGQWVTGTARVGGREGGKVVGSSERNFGVVLNNGFRYVKTVPSSKDR